MPAGKPSGVQCFMDWFPRVLGLLLLVLALTLVTDLFRSHSAQQTFELEVCPACIYESKLEGDLCVRSTRCYFGPHNRTCPACGAGWKNTSFAVRDLLEPGPMALLAILIGFLSSIRALRCPQCHGAHFKRLTRGAPGRPLCPRCQGRRRLTPWGYLRG